MLWKAVMGAYFFIGFFVWIVQGLRVRLLMCTLTMWCLINGLGRLCLKWFAQFCRVTSFSCFLSCISSSFLSPLARSNWIGKVAPLPKKWYFCVFPFVISIHILCYWVSCEELMSINGNLFCIRISVKKPQLKFFMTCLLVYTMRFKLYHIYLGSANTAYNLMKKRCLLSFSLCWEISVGLLLSPAEEWCNP